MTDGNPNIVRHSAETGGKADPIAIDIQIMAGGRADIQYDFIVADLLHGYAGMFVNPNDQMRRLAIIDTPFI